MRYLLSISYDGSKFSGFQRQKNAPSVQSEIESTLKKITKKNIEIKGAGRTDKGVHAYDQKCHFDLELNITTDKLKQALNDRLSKYIRINDCEVVKPDFHARFCVLEKEYVYKINLGDYAPILEDYAYQIPYKLDLSLMRKASKYFIGEHDYSSFISEESGAKKSSIKKINIISHSNDLFISIKGTHFYRYMIRNIVGALIEVGRKRVSLEKIKERLENPINKVILPTAPPQGLYLVRIKY